MNISKETMAILKNFASININLLIDPGNRLSTYAASRNILVEAYIGEQFPCEFTIYDLYEFLGAFNLFDNPDLEFTEREVKIGENNKYIQYRSTERDILIREGDDILNILRKRRDTIENVFTEISLSSELIAQLKKVSTVLKACDFCIIGDGNKIEVLITDKSNTSSNNFSAIVGETDKIFKANFKIENLKIIPDDYTLYLTQKLGCFTAKNIPIKYFIALENDSKF